MRRLLLIACCLALLLTSCVRVDDRTWTAAVLFNTDATDREIAAFLDGVDAGASQSPLKIKVTNVGDHTATITFRSRDASAFEGLARRSKIVDRVGIG